MQEHIDDPRFESEDISVTIATIEAAASRLRGVAHRTPVLTSNTLNELTGSSVFIKCENFQRTGAFKFRGAYNALSKLSEKEKVRDVIAFSSGNHAQAVALAASLYQVRSTIVMPADAPFVKREATKGYGAEVVIYDRSETTREAVSGEIARKRCLTIIPPFDHPDIIAGQGTAALELLEEIGDLDVLLVPCGGGGLLSGTAVSARARSPRCRVIGVEPRGADDATRSFRSKTLVRISDPQTIADGVRSPSLGMLTYPLILRLVSDMVTVSDDAIIDGMFFLWERMKLVVEPTGALPVAALLTGAVQVSGARVGVIVSGGNVDIESMGMLHERRKGETLVRA